MAVLFAPILRTTQPAFAASQDALTVYYTLPQAASLTDITNIEVKVNTQDTNTNVVNNATGILSVSATAGSFSISKGELKTGHWAAGKLYKIQARLVNSSGQKSEWSNVMITKAITLPQVKILNGETTTSDSNEISSIHSETVTMPTFYGEVTFAAGESEYLDTYRFDLWYEGKIVETSGNIQYNSSTSAAPQYRFRKQFVTYDEHSVTFSIVSNNGYEATSKPYVFEVISTTSGQITNLAVTVDSTSIACIENAMIQVRLTSNEELNGNYIIVRSDEDTNYQVWDDVAYLTYVGKQLANELVFTDYYIECGKQYKYAVQRKQTNNARSELLLPQDPSPRWVNFEYSYLCGRGTQIKLNFSGELSSFKHTQLAGKMDTLGSTYPTIAYNGHAYYAEFPLSALISAYMDEENLFMEKDFEVLSTNPTAESVRIERKFRHKVETFLNDKQYKLFKTPTEADKNIIVALTGATLSPQQSLNRMIYSFSTNAYEVAENTLSNLKDLGILKSGEWRDVSNLEAQAERGQIAGTFDPSVELFDIIRQQQETEIEGYKFRVTALRTLKLANNADTPDIVIFLINGNEINVASGKEYTLAGLQTSGITSIKLKSTATILLDYSVEKVLEEVREATVYTRYIDRDWGQINHAAGGGENQDVIEMIVADTMTRAAKTYNNGTALTKQEDGSYITSDGKMSFTLDGIETISLQNAEGAVLEIDGNSVYVGSTSQYRLQPIEDKLTTIILVNDKPMLINYKVRLVRRIQGGN